LNGLHYLPNLFWSRNSFRKFSQYINHEFQIFHKRLTFLIGPEAQEIFFKASDDVLSQQEVYDFMKPVFGAGIVYDASKKNRQVQFQAMANGLRTSRLKAYVHKVEDETRKYLRQEWGNGSGVVDILTALSELTILTASRCLHGEDVRTHIFKEVQELYHDLDHGLTPLTVFWSNAPTAAHRKRNAARNKMVELFTAVIRQRRAHPERSDGTDILSLFMDIKYKDGTPITEEQVTGLLIALLFAGQHTSCITRSVFVLLFFLTMAIFVLAAVFLNISSLFNFYDNSTWTSFFIANDGALLDRVLEEQKQVLKGDMRKKLDFDDIQNMELLHNCMRETLRMCPTFIMILRKAEREFSITVNNKKFTVPKNDYVVVSPTVSMRQKSTFPDPDTYDPHRYAAPREEHKQPYAYMGFGGGMHSCMGQNFAFLQVKTILSIMLREYEIERVAKTMPEIGYDDMVVGPKGDLRIRYTKRTV
jgi:sterol 14alpha-demethylase